MKICISKDYSETLGARYISDGDYSGEDFREKYLIPHFEKAVENQEKLIIDLDGGYGNPVSFLEEAFGGLARKYGSDKVLGVLEFISYDEPSLVEEIMEYIKKPYENTVYKQAQLRGGGANGGAGT